MEKIDTRQLSELLFVLKSADVARFKYDGMEIDFNLQPEDDAEDKVSGFTHPPVTVAEPPKSEDTGSYHKLFRGNFPRFKAPDGEKAE